MLPAIGLSAGLAGLHHTTGNQCPVLHMIASAFFHQAELIDSSMKALYFRSLMRSCQKPALHHHKGLISDLGDAVTIKHLPKESQNATTGLKNCSRHNQ